VSSRNCLKGMLFLAWICWTNLSDIHFGKVLDAAVWLPLQLMQCPVLLLLTQPYRHWSQPTANRLPLLQDFT